MKSSRTSTLLFLLISAIAIPVLVIAAQQTTIFSPKASGAVPQFLTVANLSDSTATLAWTTPSTATITQVEWGETAELGTIETDFRDKRDSVSLRRKTHYVTLSGLKQNTTYYYRITSGTTVYPSKDQLPSTFKTIPTASESAPSPLSFYGESNAKQSDGIVIIYPQSDLGFTYSLPLATTLGTDGTWLLNLASSRTSDGEYLAVDASTQLAVIYHSVDGGKVDLHTSADSPLSLNATTPLTQAAIDQKMLGATATPTATATATPTLTATPRQDVPLRPKGTTPSATPTTTAQLTADITRAQLLSSFSVPSVSNISDATLSVMFLTSTAKESRLYYGTSPTSLPSSKYNDADTGLSPRFIHHYTLTGLSSQTAYYFKSSLENTVRTITLPAKISAPSGQTIVLGELENATDECLVRTQVKRGNTLSAVITTIPGSTHTWTTNIAPVRTSSLDSYLVPGPTDTLLVNAFCFAENGDVYYQSASATVQTGMTSGMTLTLVKLQ